MSAATKGVLASKVCQLQQPGASFVNRTPDRQLLSLLGVLRRPATAADQLNHRFFSGVPEVYAGSIRRAFSRGGESYYLAVSGFDRAASIPSDQCFSRQEQALAHYLPHIPAALRAQTTALQAGYVAWARNLFTHGPRDSVCLVNVGPRDNGTDCGTIAAQIKAGMTPSNDQGVFVGIVPDGVATVTLDFPATGTQPSRSASGPVTGNVYAIHVPGAARITTEPAMTWRSAQGHVLKTIPVPTPAMRRAACQQQPITCALIQDSTPLISSSSRTTTAATRAPTR